jgi:hypothetical protein
MNKPSAIHTVSKLLLFSFLASINAFAFTISPSSSYEIVFLALSAIHAELCLFLAWAIFARTRSRYSRVVWCLLGIAIAVIATTRLLAGQWTDDRLLYSIRWGAGATLSAMLPIAATFWAQRLSVGTEIIPEQKPDRNASTFQLNYLFILIGAFAFLFVLFRHLLQSRGGWLLVSDDVGITAMSVSQAFIVGLFAGPCALIVLRPNRYCILWLAFFLVIIAIQPMLDQWVMRQVTRGPSSEWVWPESYWAVIFENTTWYGPQTLSTFLLFVIFRLTGVRIQDRRTTGDHPWSAAA